jgi:hypothetical protein
MVENARNEVLTLISRCDVVNTLDREMDEIVLEILGHEPRTNAPNTDARTTRAG